MVSSATVEMVMPSDLLTSVMTSGGSMERIPAAEVFVSESARVGRMYVREAISKAARVSIPAMTLSRIFKPLSDADSGRTRRGKDRVFWGGFEGRNGAGLSSYGS